jgi:hypothetical protein
MIHLHTSNKFADDLNKSGFKSIFLDKHSDAWHWYAHRITLMRKKCVIVMEGASRYALFFVGLKKIDYLHFEKVLTSRIVAESSWLCDLPLPIPNEQFVDDIELRCKPFICSAGLDRSVQAHIKQVAEEVEFIAKYRMGRLPESASEEFGLGLQVNKMLRKTKADKHFFVPWERWRDSLVIRVQSQPKSKVITLDGFRKGRNID